MLCFFFWEWMRVNCIYSVDRNYKLFNKLMQCSLQICHTKFGATSKPDDKITSTISVRGYHKEVCRKSRNVDGDANFPSIFSFSTQEVPYAWKWPLLAGFHPCSPQPFLPGPSHSLPRTNVSWKRTTDASSIVKHSYFDM